MNHINDVSHGKHSKHARRTHSHRQKKRTKERKRVIDINAEHTAKLNAFVVLKLKQFGTDDLPFQIKSLNQYLFQSKCLLLLNFIMFDANVNKM